MTTKPKGSAVSAHVEPEEAKEEKRGGWNRGERVHSKERIIHALEQQQGVIGLAAKVLQVSRSTLNRWIDEDPELEQIMTDARADICDLAKAQMYKMVAGGNRQACEWVLEKLGGYGNRITISGDADNPIQVVERQAVDISHLTPEEQLQFLEMHEKLRAKSQAAH